jgi:predicted nucleic acid-binding protein
LTTTRPRLHDSSVYIAAIRGGPGSAEAVILAEALPATFVAAVVLAELRAGALTRTADRLVDDMARWATTVGRLVAPTAPDWDRAARALRAVGTAAPGLRSKLPRLWNDALIAATARRLGAIVITHNAPDFALIARHMPVDIRSI